MYSREATEAVQSLSEELSSVKTQISQVCPGRFCQFVEQLQRLN